MFIPVVMLDQEAIRTPTAAPRHPLGARGITKDGRVFRYARANAALVAGRVCESHVLSEFQFGSNCPLTTDQAAGIAVTATSIKLSSTWTAFTGESGTTGIVLNYFKDGLLAQTKGTGLGQYLRIGGNTTASTGTAGQVLQVTFREEDKLVTAITTDSEFVIALNTYDRVQQTTGQVSQTTAFLVVGVAICPVTSGYYFWMQTWGPCPVLTVGTLANGEQVMNSTDNSVTGGISRYVLNASATGLDLIGGIRRPPIGTVLITAPAAEMSIVDLHIAP